MRSAFLSIAALALLQLALVANILFLRHRYKLYVGAPENPEHPLFRARLANSNAAEYAPMLSILMLCLEMYGNRVHSLPGFYVAAVSSRYLHALGLLNFTPTRPNALRALGMAGTFASMLALAGILIYQAGPALTRLP